nr:uncharacterized protein LOC115496557 isoform X8 [Taeniopygia guttata]
MIGSLFLALPMQPWPSREQGMTWPQVFQSWSSWHCFKDRSGRARKILHQQFAWEVSLLAESGFCYETALDGDIHSDSSLVAGVSQRPGPQPRYRRRLAAASPGTRDGGGRAVPRGSSGRGGRREPRGGARPGQLFLPPTRTNPLSRFSALGNGAAACAPRCPRPGQPPAVAARRDGRRHARCGLGAVGTRRRAPGGPGPRPAGSGGWRGGPGADMPGPSPGGSPERETGAGGRPRGPGRDRRVRFRLPHTAIAVPSVREEEQLFYRRLEALAVPGPGGFGPLFASDGWSDLTEDRLLRKRMVRAGLGGPRPLPGQEVSVKVLGALEDGGLVERDPRLIFVPGHGDVVQVSPNRCAVHCRASSPPPWAPTRQPRRARPQALELGVPTMQPGEVSFFLAAFPYAYGHPGREPDVPPEAPLLFEVTLLEVRDGPDPQPLLPAVRLCLGSQRRERGNFHFARGDFAAALRSYRLSLRALDGPAAAPPGPEEEEELREQRVKCLNNCAAAELKLGRTEEALAACEAALRISPDNGRALLRRGQLLAEQGRDAEAALVLRRALELDPASKVIHTELSRLAKRQSPPASTGPQNPRHDPTPPPSPASPGPPSAEGAI